MGGRDKELRKGKGRRKKVSGRGKKQEGKEGEEGRRHTGGERKMKVERSKV
jgi:hypothetical protein